MRQAASSADLRALIAAQVALGASLNRVEAMSIESADLAAQQKAALAVRVVVCAVSAAPRRAAIAC